MCVFRNKGDLDFAPNEQRGMRMRREMVHYTRLVVYALVLICVAKLVVLGLMFGYFQYTDYMARREISSSQEVYSMNRDTVLREEFFNRRVAQAMSLREGDLGILAYLEALEAALPLDFASTRIDISAEGAVLISGSVPNLVVAGDVLNVLGANGLVEGARMVNIEYEQGRMNFDIVGTMGDF